MILQNLGTSTNITRLVWRITPSHLLSHRPRPYHQSNPYPALHLRSYYRSIQSRAPAPSPRALIFPDRDSHAPQTTRLRARRHPLAPPPGRAHLNLATTWRAGTGSRERRPPDPHALFLHDRYLGAAGLVEGHGGKVPSRLGMIACYLVDGLWAVGVDVPNRAWMQRLMGVASLLGAPDSRCLCMIRIVAADVVPRE